MLKFLNQYKVGHQEYPARGTVIKAIALRVAKNDTPLLQAVDMGDGGPYEVAEPRVITALEACVPPGEPEYPWTNEIAFANALSVRSAGRSVKAYSIYCLEAGTRR